MITLFHDMQLSKSGRKEIPSADKKRWLEQKEVKKEKRPEKISKSISQRRVGLSL